MGHYLSEMEEDCGPMFGRADQSTAEAFKQMAAELSAAKAEAEANRKDAERYRWLRDSLAPAGYADTDKLDAKVDAAIAAQQRRENREGGE